MVARYALRAANFDITGAPYHRCYAAAADDVDLFIARTDGHPDSQQAKVTVPSWKLGTTVSTVISLLYSFLITNMVEKYNEKQNKLNYN